MENATKALLIAAAVLIAIVLVALGVNLLGSTGDRAEDAGKVSEQVGTSTNSAVSSLGTALGKLEGESAIQTITFYLKIKDGSEDNFTIQSYDKLPYGITWEDFIKNRRSFSSQGKMVTYGGAWIKDEDGYYVELTDQIEDGVTYET